MSEPRRLHFRDFREPRPLDRFLELVADAWFDVVNGIWIVCVALIEGLIVAVVAALLAYLLAGSGAAREVGSVVGVIAALWSVGNMTRPDRSDDA